MALERHDGTAHEWANVVTPGDGWVEWDGGHWHRCTLAGPPMLDGARLLLPTVEHGQLVLRAFDRSDTWLISRRTTAWEAHQRGLR